MLKVNQNRLDVPFPYPSTIPQLLHALGRSWHFGGLFDGWVPSALRDIADRIEDKPMVKKVVEELSVISVAEVSQRNNVGFVAVSCAGTCRLLVGRECGRFEWRLVRCLTVIGDRETFGSRGDAILEVIHRGAIVYLIESDADLKEVLS